MDQKKTFFFKMIGSERNYIPRGVTTIHALLPSVDEETAESFGVLFTRLSRVCSSVVIRSLSSKIMSLSFIIINELVESISCRVNLWYIKQNLLLKYYTLFIDICCILELGKVCISDGVEFGSIKSPNW